MRIYYIDESITPDEEIGVLAQLAEFGEDVQNGFVHKRIPFVFPSDVNSISDKDARTLFHGHIQNAGVKYGSSGVLVMPKMFRWCGSMQLAFEAIAGRSPYLVHPWQTTKSGEIERRECLTVIDVDAFMRTCL